MSTLDAIADEKGLEVREERVRRTIEGTVDWFNIWLGLRIHSHIQI